MRVCEECGDELVRRTGERNYNWTRRRFCSISHASKATNRRRRGLRMAGGPRSITADRLSELRFLLEAGRPIAEIPAALGTTPQALARWLYRYGHHPLARMFERGHFRKAA